MKKNYEEFEQACKVEPKKNYAVGYAVACFWFIIIVILVINK